MTTNTDFFLDEKAALQRLLQEYEKHGQLVVGYDFDDTVHDFHGRGCTHEKVIALLRDLRDIGCKCIAWTCYPNLKYVIDYCKEHDIPLDGVNKDIIELPWTSRKPFYSVLLDDRAGLLQVYNDLTAFVEIIKSKKHANNGTGAMASRN